MLRAGVHVFGRALRETGQGIDRLGLRIENIELFRGTFSRHRPILSVFDKVYFSLLMFLHFLIDHIFFFS